MEAEERKKVEELVSEKSQISLLEIRIKELEIENEMLSLKDSLRIDQSKKDYREAFKITSEQHNELVDILKHWIHKCATKGTNPNMINENIMLAPIPLRERFYMMFLFGRFDGSQSQPPVSPIPLGSLDDFLKMIRGGK